jgi:malonyl-ACP O-methyltransferase BioC
MAKKLAALLPPCLDTILEPGAGTGLLTREIIRKIKFKHYIANDLSEKSKKYIDIIFDGQSPLHSKGGCTFLAGNALKIKLPRKADLIVSNAMFQWFTDIEKAAAHFYNLLEPGGILAFTTFSPENFREIKTLTGLSLEYKTVREIEQALKNYEILHIEEFEHSLAFQNPLELLAHMKHTGVNSLAAKNWTFADVKDFCENYRQKYPQITLTYAPVIVIAQKPIMQYL